MRLWDTLRETCPCGSGKKYKKCCLVQIQDAQEENSGESPFITELKPDVDEAVSTALDHLASGHRIQGEREIGRLLDEHPDYHMTNFAMGIIFAHYEKKLAQAIPYFSKAVHLFPIFGSAYYNLGNCYLQTADIENAIPAFRSAKKYAEDDEVRFMAEERLSFVKQLVRTPLLPTLDDYIYNAKLFSRAFEALQAHQFEQSIVLFQRVLEKNPENVQSYGNMALAHAFLGRRARAMECFDQALALDPNYEPALVNRSMVTHMEEGQPLEPAVIGKTRYYSDYRGKNGRRSYIQDILAAVQKPISADRHDDGANQRAG